MTVRLWLAFALFALGVALGLVQLWLDWFTPETFLKLILTDGALLALLVVWTFLARERGETDRLRRDQTFK